MKQSARFGCVVTSRQPGAPTATRQEPLQYTRLGRRPRLQAATILRLCAAAGCSLVASRSSAARAAAGSRHTPCISRQCAVNQLRVAVIAAGATAGLAVLRRRRRKRRPASRRGSALHGRRGLQHSWGQGGSVQLSAVCRAAAARRASGIGAEPAQPRSACACVAGGCARGLGRSQHGRYRKAAVTKGAGWRRSCTADGLTAASCRSIPERAGRRRSCAAHSLPAAY